MESPTLHYEWKIEKLKKQLAEAKDIIKNLLRVTYGGLERVIKKIESGRRLKNKMKTKREENA